MASTMISTRSRFSFFSCSTTCLVLGASTVKPLVTTRRSWRTSSDNIDWIAPRYIFLLTFCSKERGFAANARPPPTQMGERIEPARDVPPPFCGRGLRPPVSYTHLRAHETPEHL